MNITLPLFSSVTDLICFSNHSAGTALPRATGHVTTPHCGTSSHRPERAKSTARYFQGRGFNVQGWNKAMLHSLHLCLSVSVSRSQTFGLLRLTMDKSGMVKSNYEEKLHSCPRNHVCQRPHKKTQGLLKWGWQAQRILIFPPLILSPCTCIIKPSPIKATIWKWWMVVNIGNVARRGGLT